jgi:antirestriction protein ArdC
VASSMVVQSGNSPEIQEKIARKSHTSVYEIVTERILAELGKGEVPWRKPWRRSHQRI